MLELNTKHDSVLCVARCERMIDFRIRFSGMKQDMRDKNGTHAYTEARDSRYCTAEGFTKCGSSSERWRCHGCVNHGRRVKRESEFLFTNLGTDSRAGEGEGSGSVRKGRRYMC